MAIRAAKPKAFVSEAELCAKFIAAIGDDWTPYAETAGWDILLVRKSDGLQIGIQAKLKLNVDVINQTIEETYWGVDRAAPDCRAVLVPEDVGGFGRIADYIGFTIIRMRASHMHAGGGMYASLFTPNLPREAPYGSQDGWHEWLPAKRHALPDYVPDVAAGASAPVQLTQWKIAALKIVMTLEKRGYITRGDFKQHHIDHRRWMARESGWLVRSDNGGYIAGPRLPDFKAQHPKVFAEIAATADEWLQLKPTLFVPNGALL